MGKRYYDAEIAMFISLDPAGEGWNHYGYCLGNPILFYDPTGLAHEISAEEYDYRAANDLWDPSGTNTNFDVYVPKNELSSWSTNQQGYTAPADLLYVHALMKSAFDWQGTPYSQVLDSKAGIDCSHLVWQLHVESGYEYDYSIARYIGNSPFMEQGNVVGTFMKTKDDGTVVYHTGIYNPYNTHDLLFSATSHGARWEDPSVFGTQTGTYMRVDR
ncbi:MAG: hypothetical protein PHW12_01595 [Smithella sp.]|nr:hypothetical protein [Smithella sp.]